VALRTTVAPPTFPTRCPVPLLPPGITWGATCHQKPVLGLRKQTPTDMPSREEIPAAAQKQAQARLQFTGMNGTG